MLECAFRCIHIWTSDSWWTRSCQLFIWLFDNCPLYHGRGVCSVQQKTLNLYSCRFTVPCSSILANGKYMLKINSMPEPLVTMCGGVVDRRIHIMSNNISAGCRFALCHGRWALHHHYFSEEVAVRLNLACPSRVQRDFFKYPMFALIKTSICLNWRYRDL